MLGYTLWLLVGNKSDSEHISVTDRQNTWPLPCHLWDNDSDKHLQHRFSSLGNRCDNFSLGQERAEMWKKSAICEIYVYHKDVSKWSWTKSCMSGNCALYFFLDRILFLLQLWRGLLAQPIPVRHYLSCHGNPFPNDFFFFFSGSNPSATTCDSLCLLYSFLLPSFIDYTTYLHVHAKDIQADVSRQVSSLVARYLNILSLAAFSASFAVTACPHLATGLLHLQLQTGGNSAPGFFTTLLYLIAVGEVGVRGGTCVSPYAH